MNKRQLKKAYKRLQIQSNIQASHIEYLKAETKCVSTLYTDVRTKCDKLEKDNIHLRLAYKAIEDLYQEQAKQLNKGGFFSKLKMGLRGGMA